MGKPSQRLPTKRSSLKIGAWNVNGVKTKDIDKFNDKHFIDLIKNFDILGIVETHLIASLPSPLPNYKIHHFFRVQDKKAKRVFGGISILVKKSISNGVTITDSSNSNFIWLKLDKHYFNMFEDLYICFLHIPPENSTYSEKQGDQFENFTINFMKFANKGNVMLCGDFNGRVATLNDFVLHDSYDISLVDNEYISDICRCRSSQDKVVTSRGRQLLDFCVNSRLRILNGRTLGDLEGKFTFHNSLGSSVIDYIICNESFLSKVLFIEIHDLVKSLSDHCLLSVYLSVNFVEKYNDKMSKLKTMPNSYIWTKDSIQKFQNALSSDVIASRIKNFQNICYGNNIDNAIRDINDIFITAASVSLKKKIVKRKSEKRHKQWFDRSLQELRESLDRHSKLLSLTPFNQQLRQKCFQLSYKYNKERKKKRRNFFQNLMGKLDELETSDPKMFWKLVNSLKPKDSSDNGSCIDPNSWYAHFKNLNTVPQSKTDLKKEMEKLYNDTSTPPSKSCLDEEISQKEIIQACKNLKNNKSCGLDIVINEMIKYSQHALTACIQKLFNMILKQGLYPKEWSEGYLVPLYKSSDPSNPNNYRGICITSCLGKLFNRILSSRLDDYLDSMKVIKDEQIGFKRGSRTSDHIFKLKTLICKYVVKSGKMYACFVDLRKAFDSVMHHALFYKMKRAGIGGKFLQVIESMYQGSSLSVKVLQNQLSESFSSEIGVKQGDNLSPTLFNLFLNDLVDSSTFDRNFSDPVSLGSYRFNCLLYADDIVLLSKSEAGLQSCLDSLSMYCKKWGLTINHDKSKVMIFNAAGRLYSKDNFCIDGESLSVVKEYKYLGIIFSTCGSFTSAVTNIRQRGQKAFF